MGFSWVTFIAQILNLFVLVWLLKRFLYHPIIDAITKRQAYIEGKVKKAAAEYEAAQKQREALKQEADAFEEAREKRLADVAKEVEDLKNQQTADVMSSMAALRLKTQSDLNREVQSAQLEIRNLMATHFLHLTDTVIKELSGLSPLAQALLLFQKKVSSLSKSEISDINNTLKKMGIIEVVSSDVLNAKEEKALKAFLASTFKTEALPMRFSVDKDLILGIEVRIGETNLEWHLKSYLAALETNLNNALAGLIVKE